MVEHYVVDSAHVFNQAVGARGNDTTRASDHLPVIATFVFNDQPVDLAEVRIVALLPNPAGTDAGNEQVTIRNDSASGVNLAGWVLRDRAGNEFALGGMVQTADALVITMGVFSMPSYANIGPARIRNRRRLDSASRASRRSAPR